jgi:hypothetical protein
MRSRRDVQQTEPQRMQDRHWVPIEASYGTTYE